MIVHIKGLIQALLITGILCHTAYAAEVSPSDISPSPRPSPLKGEGEKVMADAINIPDVVATVNGVDITEQALERRMTQSRSMDPERFDAMSSEQRKKAMARTIDNMVLREVIYQEAVKRNMTITDDEINLALENLKKQFPSEEAFEKTFAEYNITLSVWRLETRKNLMGIKLEEQMVDELKIDDSEIINYYEKNKKELNKDAAKISHILVATEKEAKEVIKELNNKKGSFSDLAREYSLDTFTKDKGGEVGWVTRGELLKEVEDAAYALSPGQISAPVKSQYGYHVIRLDAKETASEQTLEDHKEHVKSILQQTKWQQLKSDWLNGLLAMAKIWKWAP